MKRTLLLILLSLLLCVTSALADGADYSFTLTGTGTTATLDRYQGSDTNVYVPGTWNTSTVTAIGPRAFSGSNAVSITLPYSVTVIGENAFSGMTGLKSIFMPGLITQIGPRAFQYCTALTAVQLPGTLTEIGDGLFSGCSALQTVGLPYQLTSIGDSAFAQCTSLVGLDLPASVTTIRDFAFVGCRQLGYLTVPASVQEISAQAFVDCPNLTLLVSRGTRAESICQQRGWSYVYADTNQADLIRTNANASASRATAVPTAAPTAVPTPVPTVVPTRTPVTVVYATPNTGTTAQNAPSSEEEVHEPPKWVKNKTGWRYVYWDGSYLKSQWKKIDGIWYHFEKSGYMDHDKWVGDYFVGSDGKLVTNAWVDGYYVGADGAWNRSVVSDSAHTVGRWKKDDRGWWYQYSDGTYPKNQWLQLEGKYYYLGADGYMVCGTWVDNCYLKVNGEMAVNTWVGNQYVGSDGRLVSGQSKPASSTQPGTWVQDQKGWWYQYTDGSYPASVWVEIDGKWYHFDKKGYMEKNKWIDNTYYLAGSGEMAVDTWVDGKYVDLDGHYVQDPDPATSRKMPVIVYENALAVQWSTLYQNLISQDSSSHTSGYPTGGPMVQALVSVFDLNRDGTPELMIGNAGQSTDSVISIYTIQNGQVIPIGRMNGDLTTFFWYDSDAYPGLFQNAMSQSVYSPGAPGTYPSATTLTYHRLNAQNQLISTPVSSDYGLSQKSSDLFGRIGLTTIGTSQAVGISASDFEKTFQSQVYTPPQVSIPQPK